MSVLRVGIDCGHGGNDPGTVHEGVKEADVVGSIGANLKMLCSGHIQAIMLPRSRNGFKLPYSERAKVAVEQRCDLVLNLHCNSNPNPRAHGTWYMYWPGNPRTKDLAQELFHDSYNELATLGDPFYELDPTKPGQDWHANAHAIVKCYPMDALLIEMGFLSNEKDRKLLTDPFVQEAIAAGIYRSLFYYKKK